MAGPIRISIIGNGRQARAEAVLTARSYGLMGRQVSRTGKLVAGAFAVGSIVRAAAAAGRAGATYVSSLNKVQALTDASDRQMDRAAQNLERRSGLFAKMGQTASDAAGGVVELTKSGLSLSSSLRAVRATMTLAKAGELEVADASSLVANTLNTFSLKASAASQIANGLANAANISSADVSDLAESFKYAAPLAAKAGVSLAQTNAILAELSNSGVKASQAGTSLRGILLALQAPSTAGGAWLDDLGVKVYGADGKMRDFGSVIEDLRTSLGKLSQEDQNFALKSIFGRNSITGAQILIKGGKKALDEYTKGVKRSGAAQKLAEAASKGLAGTLSSLKAQTVSTVQELYRRFSPALDARLQSVASYLTDNKDEMIDTAIAAGRRLAPALQSLASLAKSAGETFADTAVPIAKELLPAVGDLADLAKDAADAINSLPDPVKEIGVQAGIAALILPRLTAGVTMVTSSVTLNIARLQQWRAEMTYSATRAQQTAAVMQRLGAAARAAAGIGGMVLLAQGAERADTKVGALMTTLGGAAVGFSVGGPWGAAVGGAIGLLKGYSDQVHASYEAVKASIQFNKDYADSFDQVTGAITRATRQTAFGNLQNSGALEVSRMIGIPDRAMVAAATGDVEALERIKARVDRLTGTRRQLTGPNADLFYFNRQSASDFINGLRTGAEQLTAEQRAFIRALDASKSFGQSLKGIPKNVRTEVKALGIAPSMKQIRALAREYNLTPKQVRTIVKAIGVARVRGEARGARQSLEDVGNARPGTQAWLRSLTSDVDKARQVGGGGSRAIAKSLREGPAQARANLSGYTNSIRTGVEPAKGAATAGGRGVGANLKSGIFAGFAGTAAALAAEAASAVRQAVAAAKNAGEIRSPSRLMDREVGKPLAQGLLGGFARQVTKGSDGIAKALDKLKGLIEKRLDGKKQADRRKALLKSLKAEGEALRANGKLQDAVAKKLGKATERYKSLVETFREYAASVKAGFQSYGSIVGLGTTGGGTAVTLPALLSQLAARASVAQQFTAIIEQLKSKLNATSLKQLLDQAAQGDLEGALATAQAIASGGAAAVTQINALTAQITKAGGTLGDSVSQSLFGAGIKAAEGVVKGLEKRAQRLDRVADRIADRLVKRIQAQLGIGKTSQPTAGRFTVADTHVSRTPALDAYMRQVATPAPPTTVTFGIRLTAEELSQLERGREIQADLDVFLSAGGRSKVRRKS